jgi:hypothetical protein
MLLACECDARGRLHFEEAPYPQRARINGALAAVQTVATSVIAAHAASKGVTGQKVGELIHAAPRGGRGRLAGPARQLTTGYQRSTRGPSQAPASVGKAMPARYHTAKKGAAISGQCSA